MFTQPLKSPENSTLMGSFCPTYVIFEIKKYGGAIFHDTEQ